MTKLRPMGNHVLIRRAEADEKSPGGLYIPEKAKDRPHRGRVIAAGRGYHSDTGYFVETTVKPGDIVIFGAQLGVDVQVDGETLIMVSEDGILAVVED